MKRVTRDRLRVVAGLLAASVYLLLGVGLDAEEPGAALAEEAVPASLLERCLKESVVGLVQCVPPVSLADKKTGKLDMGRLDRVMKVIGTARDAGKDWAPDYVKSARDFVSRIDDLAPEVEYIGFAFEKCMPFFDVGDEYGDPDTVLEVDYTPEMQDLGISKIRLTWRWWGWLGLAVDEDNAVRVMRIDCKALLNSGN